MKYQTVKELSRQIEKYRASKNISRYSLQTGEKKKKDEPTLSPPTLARIFGGGNVSLDKFLLAVNRMGGTVSVNFPED